MGSHLDRDTAKQLGLLAHEFEQNPPTRPEAFAQAIIIAINNGITADAIAKACGVESSDVDGWRDSKNAPGHFMIRRAIRQIKNLLREKQKLLEKPTW